MYLWYFIIAFSVKDVRNVIKSLRQCTGCTLSKSFQSYSHTWFSDRAPTICYPQSERFYLHSTPGMSALDFPLFVGKYVRRTTEQQALLLMRVSIILFVSCYRVAPLQLLSVVEIQVRGKFHKHHQFFPLLLIQQLQLRLWRLKTVLFIKQWLIFKLISSLSSLHRWPCRCVACTLWSPCSWVASLEASSCSVQFCHWCCCLLLGTAGSPIASLPPGSPCLWSVHQPSLYLACLSLCVCARQS